MGMYNPTTTYYIWDCDDFLYDIACTDENWFKNRTLKHLPHQLHTFSIDSVYVVHLQLTVLEYTSILIVFIPTTSVLIVSFM